MIKKNKSCGGHRRKNEQYPGLRPELHPKPRREYLDIDYADKLSDEEKKFMSKFNEEYYGAALSREDEPEKVADDLHNTRVLRKDCRDRNNARNRDIHSRVSVSGKMSNFQDQFGRVVEQAEIGKSNPLNHENSVIELLDLKDKVKKSGFKKGKKASQA